MMTDQSLMPFGKHKDEKLGDVPGGYLLWAYNEKDLMDRYPGLYLYIKSNMRIISQDADIDSRDRDNYEYDLDRKLRGL